MFESKINRGRANGYAPLDSGSKVPLSYLPPIQSTIDTGSFATTSSLQTFTESIDGRVTELESWSSSLTDTFATDLEVAVVSSSIAATIAVVSSATGLATTGSNSFNGNQTITGSLIVSSTLINDSVLVLTGSDIIIDSGSLIVTGAISLNGTTYTSLASNNTADFTFTSENISNNNITLDATNDITLHTGNGNIILNPDGNAYIGSANAGNGIVTDGYLSGIIGDTNTVNNSTGHTLTDNLTNIINSIPSISNLATTSSNTFIGNETISGSLNISGSINLGAGSVINGLAKYSGAVLFQPVADPDPLSQATTGTHFFVSSSNNQTGEDLYIRQIDNKVKWKWIEGKLNTGVLTGGAISYSGSLVYIKAGTGIIINHNASLTNEISPVTTYVSWNDYTASCQHITSSLATYLYVDNVGTIHQTDTYFTVDQYRTALPLGMVNHTGKNVITSVANNVATAYDDVSQVSDFIRAFGPMKLRGLTMSPATGSLKFTIEAGTSYILGGFYQQDPNNSSHKETTLIQTGSLQIARVRRDGSGGFVVDNNSGSFYNSIDSGYWDDGTGTLNSAGTGQWQIQRVFFNPFTNRCHIYYGQNVYTSFINAKQYLATDSFVEADYSSHQYVFLGYLIVKGQTSNLSDSNNNAVIQSGLFRNTVGSSGGVQEFTHLHDLADVEVANPSNKDLLSYNASAGLWEHHNFTELGLATTSSFNGLISGSSQLTASFDTRYALSGSSGTIPVGTISGSSQLTASFDTRYLNTGGDGIISGSSQLTSSFDTRYAPSASYLSSLNGAISSSSQVLGGSGIYSSSAQLPSGLVSGSSQLTASYDTRYTLSGSVVNSSTPAGTISGSSQLTSSFDGRYVQTGSFNSFTASALTTGSNSFNGNQTITGSLIVSSVAVVNGSLTTPTGSLISLTSGSSIFVDASGGITGSLTGSIFGIGDVSAFSSSVNTRLNNITSSATPAGTISGSSQLTSSFEVRGSGIYSSSAQLPAGLISGSSQLPSGTISGSSQLTSSYDLRYSLSGSGGGTIPAGTISGSSQLTASYDGRYVQTGSFNSFSASINTYTASVNIWTSSIATTGSNIFNGNQTITGSLNLTNGNIVASSITANTASLYLTSGSNLYIQNNSIAEITGSLKISGSITINSGSIIMPNRPAFRVVGVGGPTYATTVLSGSMVSIDYNEGGYYNTTNGTFTAPIAGLYQVNLTCRTYSNTSAAYSQAVVVKNNTTGSNGTVQVMIEWGANTTMNHTGGSTISKLAVGDTLKAAIFAGTASFDVNDNFSVAYIG